MRRSAPAMSAKLWPAEKTGPLAAMTTARASLAPAARTASVSSAIIAADSALRFSGRSRVIVVVGPSRCTVRFSKVAMTDSIPRPGARRESSSGQASREIATSTADTACPLLSARHASSTVSALSLIHI